MNSPVLALPAMPNLPPPETQASLHQLILDLAEVVRRRGSPLGLDEREWQVLTHLQWERETTLIRLAKATGIHRMVLTRNVRKLRTLGFAKWELLPNGRYLISVTPAGQAAYAQALQMHPSYALLQLEPGKLQFCTPCEGSRVRIPYATMPAIRCATASACGPHRREVRVNTLAAEASSTA